ncbi:MAG: hypothetical protein IPM50_07070 [Acidobacteriota bacterium]|nr:MAG: hypothetical protein IPM50_07070 [Acidobacteriota bacterium]
MHIKTLKIAVPFLCFGMVLAISFREAPLKFQAPGITIPLGLGIGRLVFFALNKMEIVWALLLHIAFVRDHPNTRTMNITIGMAFLILFLETVWLLPLLGARTDKVIAGTAEPFSKLHVVYIVLGAIKLILLAVLGIATTRRAIAGAAT